MLGVYETRVNTVVVNDVVKGMVESSLTFIEASQELVEFRKEIDVENVNYTVVGNQIDVEVEYYVNATGETSKFKMLVPRFTKTSNNIAKRLVNKIVAMEKLTKVKGFDDADYSLGL